MTIRKCDERDRDPKRPASDQVYCLFTKDGDRLLGRHPSMQEAQEQEAAIHARGGKARNKMQYIKLAEVPEEAVKSLYDEKWGEGIMRVLGEDFPVDSKAAQFLFFSVWNAVVQLMDKALMNSQEVDTTEFSKDPTFMQSLAGLAYFVADDAIKSSLGLKSDSLQKGKGHLEALMAVLDKDADAGQTLEGLKKKALPVVDKAFDQVTQYLKEPEQKAASTKRTRPELFVAFIKQAAFGEEDMDDWAEQPREYILRYTYCLVTPESAAEGDCEERGWVKDGYEIPVGYDDEQPDDEDINMYYDSLAELVDALSYDHSWFRWSSSPAGPGDWIVSQEEENYSTGGSTQYNAHITHGDGSDLNDQEMVYIHDQLDLFGGVRQFQSELPLEAQTKTAKGWDKLPKGWTQESVNKFWSGLTGERKHKVTACIKKLDGKVDDPGAVCASLADMIPEMKGWRNKPRKSEMEAEPAQKEPLTPDKVVADWISNFSKDATGGASLFVRPVVNAEAKPSDWFQAAEQEGLYIPATKRDIPYAAEYLQEEMNAQLAEQMNRETVAGSVGTFMYAQQGDQWGLIYETPALEDVRVAFSRPDDGEEPAKKTESEPDDLALAIDEVQADAGTTEFVHNGQLYREATEEEIREARKTSRPDRPRGRKSRAPAMQLTQQLGQQPRPKGKREPQETEKEESWLKRSLKWLENKSREAATDRPRARWGRLRKADAKRLDNRSTTRQAGCGCRKKESDMNYYAADQPPLPGSYAEIIEVDPDWHSMGKFEHQADEVVYEWSLDGGGSASLGEAETFGYYELIEEPGGVLVREPAGRWGAETYEWTFSAAIMAVNNQGFVRVEYFDSIDEARRVWDALEEEYSEFLNQSDDPDYY